MMRGEPLVPTARACASLSVALKGFLIVSCFVTGCSTAPEQTSQETQAATACNAEALMGFEALGNWVGSHSTLSLSTRRIQGNGAIRVHGCAHLELRSVATCARPVTPGSIAFYLASTSTSSAASTVTASLRVEAPARGLAPTLVGKREVRIAENGSFVRVEMAVPSNIGAKVNGATDLRFTFAIDSPGTSSADYIVDDLSMSDAPTTAVEGSGDLQTINLSFEYPSTVDVMQLALLGQQRLVIGDRAKIVKPGGFAMTASMGGQTTKLGVEAKAGTIVSVPNVALADRSTVTGDVISGGTIARGNSVVVTGQSRTAVTLLPAKIFSWTVQFRASSTQVQLEPKASRTLAPGPYANVVVKNGATLTLTTGTYYFDSFDLDPNGKLIVVNDTGPIVVYVRNSIIWHGVLQYLGRAGDLMIVSTGATAFAVESSFDGTIVAPLADVRMGVGNTPHSGALFARSVQIDPGVTFNARVPLNLVTALSGANGAGDKTTCGITLTQTTFGQTASARDLQEALLRYCGGSDAGPCETTLLSQINVDYQLAATQLVRATMTPSKHMAFMLDRERKKQQIHGNEALACSILNSDPDGDFVPTPRDGCPGTPQLTATLDNGCTDPASPAAPALGDILAAVPSLAISGDARCFSAPSPKPASPFGAWRFPSDPSVGKAIWISRDSDTSGCPLWYMIQAKLTDGSFQTVAFRPEQDTNVAWLQRASNILQFNIHTSDAGGRGAWANYAVFTDRYRVQVVNAAGRRSRWSNWYRPGQEGCAAGACQDF